MSRLRKLLLTALVSGGIVLSAIVAGAAQAASCVPGPGKDLTGCDFSGQDLSTANLTAAILTNANLSGTNLTNASLTLVSSGGVSGTPSLPQGWRIVSGYLVGQYANLSGADLSSLDLSGFDLTGANLGSANLEHSRFSSTNISGADFTGAKLSYLISGPVTGSPSALPAGWSLNGGRLIGPYVDLSGQTVNISGAFNLHGANLSGVQAEYAGMKMGNTDFSDANLSNASLFPYFSQYGSLAGQCSDFRGANFTNANLSGAVIKNSAVYGQLQCGTVNLVGANFTNANLSSATFTNVDVSGSSFQSANVAGFKLSGIVTNVTSGLLQGTASAFQSSKQVAGFFVGPNLNVSGADLSGANLAGLNMSGADLTNTNLSWASLVGANLTNVKLPGANLDNAYLTSATLSGVKSGGLLGQAASLPSTWKLTQGYLVGPGANLTNAVLTGANLAGVSLANATLTWVASGAISGVPTALPLGWGFCNGYLIGPNSVLTNANLTGANLAGINLAGAVLQGVKSGSVAGLPSALPPDWKVTAGYLVGPGADLTSANLTGADLNNVSLAGATLTALRSGLITGSPSTLPSPWKLASGYLAGPSANFAGLNMTSASLKSCDLTGADFTNTNLNGVDFSNTILTQANFLNSNLNSANLFATTLSQVDLSSASLTEVKSGSIKGVVLKLPPKWVILQGYAVGPSANLSTANLSQVDLAGQDLTDTNLSSAILTGVSSGNIIGAPKYLPAGWQLFKGYLIGSGASLRGIDLSGINIYDLGLHLDHSDLSGANLSKANLRNADISGITLTSATLSGVKSGGLLGQAASLPSTWKLTQGYLVGPGANLTNAVLTGANLAGVSLANATLTWVASGAISGVPTALPLGWGFCNGYLIGPNSVLTNANLTGANLAGINLAGAVLQGVKSGSVAGLPSALPPDWKVTAGYLVGPGADLTSANLTGADLNNVSLAGATLTALRSGLITGSPSTLPSPWKLASGYLAGPSANFAGLNMTSASLKSCDLTGADFTNTNLNGVDFSNTILTQANFLNSNLNSANLFATTLSQVDLSSASLTEVKSGSIKGVVLKLPPKWVILQGYAVGPSANLSTANLSQVDLAGQDLTDTNLSSAILTGVSSGNIIGAPKYLPAGWQLFKGYLIGSGASLRGIDLSGINIYDLGLHLDHSDLSGANLSKANLRNADISGITLTNANLFGVSSGSRGQAEKLPEGWAQVNQLNVGTYLLGPGANLTNANLSGLTIKDLSLEGADLTYASLSNASLSNTNLENVDLTGAGFFGLNSFGLTGVPSNLGADYRIIAGTIVGPRVNITGDQLKNADLSGVSLQDANLRGDLSGVTTDGSLGTPWILPNGWVAINGYLIGPGAKIDHANLSGATLANLNIAGAVLEHANLAGAQIYNTDLTGVQLGHANLSSISSGGLSGNPASLPDGWQITAQLLVGPSANLSNRILENVNLSGRNLTGTNLSGASLIGADLSGCDLTNANLLGAILRGTNLLGATVLDTTFTSGDLESLGFVASNGTLLHRMTGGTTPTVSGVTRVGMVLNAATGTWASGIDLQLQWLRDGFPIVGQTSSTYILVPGDATHAVSVSVTATSPGFAPLVVLSDAFQIGLGTITSPTGWAILGNTAVGSTLNAPLTGWTEGVTIQYQWIKDNVDIAGATDSTYQLQPGDAGHYIKLRADASKLGYISSGSTSVALRVALQQMNPARVSISGTVKVGKSIKAVSASWVAGSKTIFQWLLDGKAIKGATKQNFTVLPAQKGHKLSVKVTQSLEGYTSASQTSSAIKVG